MNSLCCRAGPCDQPANCIAKGACQYKSSSEERTEELKARSEYNIRERERQAFMRGANWEIYWRGKAAKSPLEAALDAYPEPKPKEPLD